MRLFGAVPAPPSVEAQHRLASVFSRGLRTRFEGNGLALKVVGESIRGLFGGQPVLLVEQPLIKAQAKQYVRLTKERLIGTPILQRLIAHYGEDGTAQRLLARQLDEIGAPAQGASVRCELFTYQMG